MNTEPLRPTNSRCRPPGAAMLRVAPAGGTAARPLAPPLELASVWEMSSPEHAAAALGNPQGAFVYRRDGHPNARSLGESLADLHGASAALVTGQGMSAMAAVALASLAPGDHVWIGQEMYGKTAHLFARHLAHWGVECTEFDPCHDQASQQIRHHRPAMVVVETLTNPRLRVADLADLQRACHDGGGRLVVDNTFATCGLCRPLDLGADVVVESLSKQVCGHSDSMLGLICTRDDAWMARAADVVSTFGLASSPLDCYLTQRGLMSLDVRLERACENAKALAEALQGLGGVRTVDYPGLPSHPGHEVARRQLGDRFGWMLAFQVAADRPTVERIFHSLTAEFPFAPSLGDARTTISHPATTSHRGYAADRLAQLGIDYGTIRVSCGLEPADWLVDTFCHLLRC
ncbi:MAG: hypothetical protein D6753_07470 [Planctomycetota bacterium]|nr:MAG: hypothetical protein D6753_07470 [Planctomycetota bacterium]